MGIRKNILAGLASAPPSYNVLFDNKANSGLVLAGTHASFPIITSGSGRLVFVAVMAFPEASIDMITVGGVLLDLHSTIPTANMNLHVYQMTSEALLGSNSVVVDLTDPVDFVAMALAVNGVSLAGIAGNASHNGPGSGAGPSNASIPVTSAVGDSVIGFFMSQDQTVTMPAGLTQSTNLSTGDGSCCMAFLNPATPPQTTLTWSNISNGSEWAALLTSLK